MVDVRKNNERIYNKPQVTVVARLPPAYGFKIALVSLLLINIKSTVFSRNPSG